MRHAVALAVVLSLCAAAPAPADIRVLSNRADLISGGDALVQVTPAGSKVTADGRDVTPQFAVRPDGRYLALLTGLRNGRNVVVSGGQRLTIVNHPVGGPTMSGPQIQPWTCADGALDAQCDRAVKYEFFYKSTGGGDLKAYDPDNPPSDVASTQ